MPATDPTFYRSPGAAVAVAPEQIAYVAAFDPTGQQNDALAVLDCEPNSSTYGGVVGRAGLVESEWRGMNVYHCPRRRIPCCAVRGAGPELLPLATATR
jgi:hypothetical protein